MGCFPLLLQMFDVFVCDDIPLFIHFDIRIAADIPQVVFNVSDISSIRAQKKFFAGA